MVDFFGSFLFLAAGQALAWAFLRNFSWPVKVGAGVLTSLSVPALASTGLSWAGVPFNTLSVYLVFLALLAVGVYCGGWISISKK